MGVIRRLLVIIVALGALIAAAPSRGAVNGQRRELERNRTLWAQQHIRDYRFRLRVYCFCPSRGHAVTITVRGGRPHGATGFQTQFDTVPELFRQIRHALDDPDAGEIKVRYDARRGFPRSASIDRIKNAIDDEISWKVDRFRRLR